MSRYKFIWIDDDPRRRVSSDNLKSALGFLGQFVAVKGDYQDNLDELFNGSEPDLIIMDHNLEKSTTGVFKKGSTFAAFIRETWNECPIVCVTGQDIDIVDSQQRSLYEDVFSISQISKYYPTIRSISESFRILNRKRPKDIADLFDLMKAPVEDIDRLKTIMPIELKENFKDKSQLLNISHWVRNVLLKRPGFVYDRMWLATTLGIKESSLVKVESIFSRAKYSGIFADESNDLWWKSKALDTLTNQIDEVGLPWEKGRKLPGIIKRDYSICYASGEDFPETVAFIDETKDSKRASMKLQYTESHPNYGDLLFFEEIRIMKS